MRSRKLVMATVIAGLMALAAVPAAAAGNGNGNGLKRNSSPAATLHASCNPCAAGDVVTFWGEGYDASQGKVILDMNGAYTSAAVYADGSINFDWHFFQQPYTYTVDVWQNRNKKHLELKATMTVEVVAAG